MFRIFEICNNRVSEVSPVSGYPNAANAFAAARGSTNPDAIVIVLKGELIEVICPDNARKPQQALFNEEGTDA